MPPKKKGYEVSQMGKVEADTCDLLQYTHAAAHVHLSIMFETLNQKTLIRTHEGSNLFAVSKEAKGRQRPHTQDSLELRGHLVHVYFNKDHVGVLGCQIAKDGGNLLTWSAPNCETIHDNEAITGCFQSSIVLIFTVAKDDGSRSCTSIPISIRIQRFHHHHAFLQYCLPACPCFKLEIDDDKGASGVIVSLVCVRSKIGQKGINLTWRS
jgi:hypothetical protein